MAARSRPWHRLRHQACPGPWPRSVRRFPTWVWEALATAAGSTVLASRQLRRPPAACRPLGRGMARSQGLLMQGRTATATCPCRRACSCRAHRGGSNRISRRSSSNRSSSSSSGVAVRTRRGGVRAPAAPSPCRRPSSRSPKWALQGQRTAPLPPLQLRRHASPAQQWTSTLPPQAPRGHLPGRATQAAAWTPSWPALKRWRIKGGAWQRRPHAGQDCRCMGAARHPRRPAVGALAAHAPGGLPGQRPWLLRPQLRRVQLHHLLHLRRWLLLRRQ